MFSNNSSYLVFPFSYSSLVGSYLVIIGLGCSYWKTPCFKWLDKIKINTIQIGFTSLQIVVHLLFSRYLVVFSNVMGKFLNTLLQNYFVTYVDHICCSPILPFSFFLSLFLLPFNWFIYNWLLNWQFFVAVEINAGMKS